MHVVSHKAIRIFCEEHPSAGNSMDRWYRVAKRVIWTSFAEVRQSFNTADFVAPYVVFDVRRQQVPDHHGDQFQPEGAVHPRHHDAPGICERSVEVMSTAPTIDRKKYTRLANRVVVKAIETEEEYDRMVAAVEHLMDKGEDRLSPEESALLETMAILVQAYDDRHHPLPPVAPNEMLSYLMESSGRRTKDLLPMFGTRGRVSEILSGKRSISKEQAKKLAALFKVSADLFI